MRRILDRLLPGLAMVLLPALALWWLGYVFTARMLAVCGGGIWIIIPPPYRTARRALALAVILGGLSLALDVFYWHARSVR
jgi:hypothetical protein